MSGRRGRGPKDRTEHFTKMIRSTMQEPAWRALSSTAQAIYPWLKLEWKGVDNNNNGKIRLSIRQIAGCIGSTPDTASRGVHDLQRKGFVVVTEGACLGIEGAAKSPAYELTEIKMPGADGDGRKLYRQWEKGQDFPIAEVMANNPNGRNGSRAKPCHENRDATVMKNVTKLRRAS